MSDLQRRKKPAFEDIANRDAARNFATFRPLFEQMQKG